jgi:hypothetical protein
MNSKIDNLYWLFSAAAQSISAFVAFLLTGYALVHSIMDNREKDDPSLTEVHEELKKTYHIRLTLLSICTATAILGSLLCVYLNPYSFRLRDLLYILTASFDIVAILGGIFFVVAIVNPEKYRRVAKKLLAEERSRLEPTGKVVNVGEFMTAFIALERSVRDFIEQHRLLPPVESRRFSTLGFSEMVNTLFRNAVISRNNVDELMEISKYRNLVVHGRVEEVDQAMVQRVRNAIQHWEQLASNFDRNDIQAKL